jgi:hypothetical protein
MFIKVFEGTDLSDEFDRRTKNSLSKEDELIIGLKLLKERNELLNEEMNALRKDLGIKPIDYGK